MITRGKTSLRTWLALVLFSCACSAQSRYNNQIQPGLHTRAEVERIFGVPVRTLAANSYEYTPPAGAERLVVQYASDSGIVQTIEAIFAKPYARATMVQALRLPEQPQQSATGKAGTLMEFYGEPAFLVFTYATAETASGVKTLGYHTRESFARMLADRGAAATPPAATTSSGARAAPPAAAPPTASNRAPSAPSAAGEATPVVTPGPGGAKQNHPGLQKASTAATPVITPGPRAASGSPRSSPPASKPRTPPGGTYQGPSSGVVNWSGRAQKDQLITIEGLPGIPVMIDLNAKEFSVVEPPSPANNWQRLVIRSRRQIHAVISVRWTAIQ